MTQSEAQTRKRYIDEALRRSGWNKIVPFKEGRFYKNEVVEEYPTSSGPADYVLFCVGQPVAIIEGKKVSVGPQNVLQQAQRYARTFQNSPFSFGEYKIPFVFSTNGTIIWFQDLRHPLNRSREIAQFHTPSALMEFLARNEDEARVWLADGCRNDKRAFEPKYFDIAEKIFELILPLLKGEKHPDTQRDALTYALNTTLGRTIMAYVSFSLRVARATQKEIKNWGRDRYEKFFNIGIEACIWFGEYLPQMRYLDKKYTEEKIEYFTQKDAGDFEWQMFMDGRIFDWSADLSGHIRAYAFELSERNRK